MSRYSTRILSRQGSTDNDRNSSNPSPINNLEPHPSYEEDSSQTLLHPNHQTHSHSSNNSSNTNHTTTNPNPETTPKLENYVTLKCQIYHELDGMIVIGLIFKNKNYIGTLLDTSQYKYSAPIRHAYQKYPNHQVNSHKKSSKQRNTNSRSHSRLDDAGSTNNSDYEVGHE